MSQHRTIAVADGVALEVATIDCHEPGSRVAVLGGVHGDELEGVVAVGRLLQRLEDAPLRGRLDLVRVANPAAHAACSRTTPQDGRNLAREFPGDAHGSVTQRIAQVLTQNVIYPADLLIDLHSAGAHYEMPVFVGYGSTGSAAAASQRAAHAFGAPTIWRHSAIGPGRSLSAASALAVASIYVEGSGGGSLRGRDLDMYESGVLRVLAMLDMIGDAPAAAGPSVLLDGGDGDVDDSIASTTTGLCITRCAAGDDVLAGQLLAEVVAHDGRTLETLSAPRAGRVMMLRRTMQVRAGDGIAMLGPLPDEAEAR